MGNSKLAVTFAWIGILVALFSNYQLPHGDVIIAHVGIDNKDPYKLQAFYYFTMSAIAMLLFSCIPLCYEDKIVYGIIWSFAVGKVFDELAHITIYGIAEIVLQVCVSIIAFALWAKRTGKIDYIKSKVRLFLAYLRGWIIHVKNKLRSGKSAA